MAGAVVAIHGGAGTLARTAFTLACMAAYYEALGAVLGSAQASLAHGAAALDVVTEAAEST